MAWAGVQAFGCHHQHLCILEGHRVRLAVSAVLAAIVLAWLERAWREATPITIGVGASNYNALDNLLVWVADLLDRRREMAGEPALPTRIARVRSSYAQRPADPRLADIERNSTAGLNLAEDLDSPSGCTIVGGTWMQLEKLAKRHSHRHSRGEVPAARWFDLLLIDEASQLAVAYAAAYFLLLKEDAAGMSPSALPFVDTVDRFQGQERDLIIASYTVADRDFVTSEERFILDPRRFNVTLTRARGKFIMFVSEALIQYLPSDAEVARDAAHLQLFVENYCSTVDETIALPFLDGGGATYVRGRLRGRR